MTKKGLLVSAAVVAAFVVVAIRQASGPADRTDRGAPSPVRPGTTVERLTQPTKAGREVDARPAAPPADSGWTFVVVDAQGAPVEGVGLAMAGNIVERSDGQGLLECSRALTRELVATEQPLTIEDARFVTAVLDRADVGSLERVVLQRAWTLTLEVLDPAGAPVHGALCTVHDPTGAPLKAAQADRRGTVVLESIGSNPIELLVHAKGFAPHRRRLVAGVSGEEHLTVHLEPGTVLEVLVSDASGALVLGAEVVARRVRITGDEPGDAWYGVTDRHGLARLEDFPVHGSFQVEARAPDYAASSKTFVATRASIDEGLELILTPFARLEVAVRDTLGRPVQAEVSTDVWQTDDSIRANGLVIGHPQDAVAIDDFLGTYLLENVPAGPSITVYAKVGGALVGSQRDLRLQPGERRAITIVVPEHLQVSISLEGLPCAGSKVRLRALDGRPCESTAPPWAVDGRRPITYEAAMDGACRAELLLTEGLYRVTVHDAAGRLIHAQDRTVDAGGELIIRAGANHLSGRLTGPDGARLSGWSVVASATSGLSVSTRTSTDGQFSFEGLGAERVHLYALTPKTWMSVHLASDVELPARSTASTWPRSVRCSSG